MPVDLETFEQLVAARRSSLLCEPERPVPDDLLTRLCRTVTAAPNHRRTLPWRLAIFTGDGRRRLGEALAEDLVEQRPDIAEARLEKVRTKYRRAPSVVVAGCGPDDDPTRHREDGFAVAAGIEHLLLGAAAVGLNALWSSPPVLVSPRLNALAGFEPATEVVGIVYVGWAASQPADADRPAPAVSWVR